MKDRKESLESNFNSDPANPWRLIYFFSYCVGFELERIKNGSVPTHRLWGGVEMFGRGCAVELSPGFPAWWIFKGTTGWRVWQTLWGLLKQRNVTAVVAVHEITAIFVLLARILRWKCAPVVVFDLSLLHPKNTSGYRLWIWRFLLREADRIVSLVKTNGGELSRRFGVRRDRIVFLPMSVDCTFSGRADPAEEERYVLAVGTNDGKDFETLLEALPLGQRLVIVTDSYNAQKVRSHPCFGSSVEVREAVPALELRALYRSAGVVVVPLADTPHGSGHTVLLETMAMGKIVVVSNARCMRDYIGRGDAVVSVPAGDAKALRTAIVESLKYPEQFKEMRERAAVLVRSKFEIERFGSCFEKLVKDLLDGRGTVQEEERQTAGNLSPKENESYASVS